MKKGKFRLILGALVVFAFLMQDCGGGPNSQYSKHKKGKHSRGGKRIKTEMGGYL